MSRVTYGFSGFISSGKDAAASSLIQSTGATKFSFAGPLKDTIATVFSWDRQMLDGITPESRGWREQRDEWWSDALGFDVTPRKILQLFGTEVGRSFHKELWIRASERRLLISPAPVAIFTDCRFGNEMTFIRSQQPGAIVWVHREGVAELPGALVSEIKTYSPLSKLAATPLVHSGLHSSETSFLTEGADLINIVLLNDSSLSDLLDCVQHLHHVVSMQTPTEVIPYATTTVYLRKHLNHFNWMWRSENTLQCQWLDLPAL